VNRPPGGVSNQVWERDERTLSRSTPDVVVLLGPEGRDSIVLRGTGVALWGALDPPASTEDLAARLAKEFGTDLAAVRSDIEPVVAQLAAAGVLRATS
jgi:Coenzyme PQQ synthesis protein D (PqqD)